MNDWSSIINREQSKPYYATLAQKLREEYANYTCYPAKENIFRAFYNTPLDKVKVVILGQDPYHEPGQAMGMSFSVPNGTKLPPSLKNIYKELDNEFGTHPDNGDLTFWANQGVLLLNTILTVRMGEAKSHHGLGWENFIDSIIEDLNNINRPIVFMLWGKDAQRYQKFLTNKNHLVLSTSHPSPFSANRGFLGCNHFKDCNSFLLKNGITTINWVYSNVVAQQSEATVTEPEEDSVPYIQDENGQYMIDDSYYQY